MCSPMYELPEHLMIAVNVNGDGPAEGDDVAGYACWCGDNNCTGKVDST